MTDQIAIYKQEAAERAVACITPGMIVGLGHGSTAIFALRKIAALYHAGHLPGLLGIPCSREVQASAVELGIPLTTLERHPVIDLTIDGADEVDAHLDVIKGGGGALLHEKIVAQASRREIIVIDERKLSPALGTRFSIPIEVIPFGYDTQPAFLTAAGARQVTRRHTADGAVFHTDEGNYILDAQFGPLPDPYPLAAQLDARTGIVEHGLFLKLITDVIVAGKNGIRHLRRE